MTLVASATTISVTLGFLQVMGALGVFLFGMKVMSEAVQRVAGKRMRMALSGLTSNRFSGIFTGFVTTSLVQSSSATTVLVVSFVNAGLLTLIKSIGVIMGANLGTTITACIVAIVGKFNVPDIALPIIDIGRPFVFIGRDNATRIAAMLRAVSELEEVTDRIYRLVKVVQRKYEKCIHFEKFHDDEIRLL